jgi:hypothetical protein
LAATVTCAGCAKSRSAISVRTPTVPAPTISTLWSGSTRVRSAAWIAHANGSINTAVRSEIASGIAWSCDR